MDEATKRAVKKTILALRRLLETEDIPTVLRQHGIFPDGRRVPVDRLGLLDDEGKKRRERLEPIIEREVTASGGDQKVGVRRYCREVAFTYLNRLVALRCMEVRALIEECIKTREDYAGRSLRHHRFLKENPGSQFDAEDTESLKAFLRSIFRELQNDIRILFDPDDEYSIVLPSLQALKKCVRALNEDIPEQAFKEPELIGWVYQYFQTEEKDRVFEEVRTKKKKIEGDDIVPATSLYTERYMVDYLVQNSLGAIWMEMYPDSRLCENWPYFVKDQDLKTRDPRPVRSLTFLDPACGSGHFLLVAFDLLVQMYEEEGRLAEKGKIPKEWTVPKEKVAVTILESNLHGIDIDLRSVQLSYMVLYLKSREHQDSADVPKLLPKTVNLVTADASLLNTPEFLSWCESRFKEEPYAFNIIKGISGRLANLPEIGSLARPEEDLRELIHKEKERLFSAWKKGGIPEQIPLFRDMLTPEQQELPFEQITDDQFWGGVLIQITRALDDYYEDASKRGDTRAQVMAHEANRGFEFLKLSNKRFDAVATNPPYMGSKNMGKDLKDFVRRVYPEGKRDLYTAFIQRSRDWTSKDGIVAMVAQQSWMFFRSFAEMRERILKEACIRTLAHLGPGAFSEIGGHVVSCALFTLANQDCLPSHYFVAFRLVAFKSTLDKRRILKRAILGDVEGVAAKPKQVSFLEVPEKSLVYWLSEKILAIVIDEPSLGSLLDIRQGLSTADNNRFVHYFWEGPCRDGWVPFDKGGGYRRWWGNRFWLVDWTKDGQRIKSHILSAYPYLKGNWGFKIQATDTYFKKGLTYSETVGGCLGVRILVGDGIYDFKSPGLFVKNSEASPYGFMAGLNSRLASYIIRAFSPTMEISYKYLEASPAIVGTRSGENLVSICVLIQRERKRRELVERDFDKSTIKPTRSEDDELLLATYLSTVEGILDANIMNKYGICDRELEAILEETSTPAGWHPLIKTYDAIPHVDLFEESKAVTEYLQRHERISLSKEDLRRIKTHLRALYEGGAATSTRDVIEEGHSSSGDERDTESLAGIGIPVPTESFLEQLSGVMEIHPISIYRLLKEMREKEGLVCWPERKRYFEDYIAATILMLLSFRWPKDVDANKPIPQWADRDGIIPMTARTGEKTLLERVRDRMSAEFGEDRIGGLEDEFTTVLYNAASKEAEVKGRKLPRKKITLAQWLEKGFFKRHVSQFKKRPVAWHLTSSNGTFQVLLFCQKISQDTLKNLRTKYLKKVQDYYLSLLARVGKGESTPEGISKDRLAEIASELEEFSDRLGKLIDMPYEPLIDDGVRVNIAPFQKLGLLASPVLAKEDVGRAIADRNRWREDDKLQDTVWRL